uniref:Uncharacterized protein n=1 Tax=Thermofilum pendens TaxID=2269 RepID=A0A7C3WUP9_THEPE
MAGGRVDLVRAGFHLWASMYRHSKTALLVTLLRTYLVLLFLAALGGGTSRHSLAAQALASLLITTTVDSMWDMAGSLLAQRLAGVLTYAALAPRRLSEVVLLTYMPRYLAEAALKALSLAPVLIALAGADGLVLLGVALALGLVGALPLAGIGLLVAMLTLLAREEAPWLDWLAPLAPHTLRCRLPRHSPTRRAQASGAPPPNHLPLPGCRPAGQRGRAGQAARALRLAGGHGHRGGCGRVQRSWQD